MVTTTEALCRGLPNEFHTYMNYVRSLRFDDKPDYSYLRKLFRDLFIRENFQYDYMFDWLMIKHQGKIDDRMKNWLAGIPGSAKPAGQGGSGSADQLAGGSGEPTDGLPPRTAGANPLGAGVGASGMAPIATATGVRRNSSGNLAPGGSRPSTGTAATPVGGDGLAGGVGATGMGLRSNSGSAGVRKMSGGATRY